ncbi:MAG TPA: DoxX family protein [Bacteroidetes bacterium]|nr:DoxX family protein [Bacteroidota bacterium]
MNGLLKFGKYLFAIPFLLFGIMHLMSAKEMAAMAPFGGEIVVYITGLAMIAAAISIFIGKMDKLATTLLGVMLLLFIVSHVQMMGNEQLPQMVRDTQPFEMLKNIALAGAAWMYASGHAKDDAVIG